MKDSHIYKRLNNINAYKTYTRMIQKSEIDIVIELMDNITKEADDHPKYKPLKDLYEARLNAKE